MKRDVSLWILALATIVGSFSACRSPQNHEEKEHAHYDALLQDKLSSLGRLHGFEAANQRPSNVAQIRLGHVLYYDTRLSKDGNISCNSCHQLNNFGVDGLSTSPGDDGTLGDRNSPTVLFAALHGSQFWDGRAKDVEEQAGMPILNPVEMRMPSKDYVVERIAGIPLYQRLFRMAYPDDPKPITYENLQKAIGAFERRLVYETRFDRYLSGDSKALSLQEKKGLLTFINVGCTSCHNGPLLGGNMLQKFGVYANYWEHTGSQHIDKGRYQVTQDEADQFVFKVPSLRNITRTAPYFHDGSVKSLPDAIRIMAKTQLNKELSEEEVNNMVAFFESLECRVPSIYQLPPTELLAE